MLTTDKRRKCGRGSQVASVPAVVRERAAGRSLQASGGS